MQAGIPDQAGHRRCQRTVSPGGTSRPDCAIVFDSLGHARNTQAHHRHAAAWASSRARPSPSRCAGCSSRSSGQETPADRADNPANCSTLSRPAAAASARALPPAGRGRITARARPGRTRGSPATPAKQSVTLARNQLRDHADDGLPGSQAEFGRETGPRPSSADSRPTPPRWAPGAACAAARHHCHSCCSIPAKWPLPALRRAARRECKRVRVVDPTRQDRRHTGQPRRQQTPAVGAPAAVHVQEVGRCRRIHAAGLPAGADRQSPAPASRLLPVHGRRAASHRAASRAQPACCGDPARPDPAASSQHLAPSAIEVTPRFQVQDVHVRRSSPRLGPPDAVHAIVCRDGQRSPRSSNTTTASKHTRP